MDRIQQAFSQVIKPKAILFLVSIVFFGVLFLNLSSFTKISSFTSLRNLSELPVPSSRTPNSIIDYHFIKNISQYPYLGQWSDSSFEKPFSTQDHGEVRIFFSFPLPSENNQTVFSLLQLNHSLDISFLLLDGEYYDNMLRGNTSLLLPIDFHESIIHSIETHSPLMLVNKNISLSVSAGEYFSDIQLETYNSTDIELTFTPSFKTFPNDLEFSSSNIFSNVSLKINSIERGFVVKIEDAEMDSLGEYSVKILNYSILLSILSLIEIYYATQLLIEVSDNIQTGLNVDIITIEIQIMWNAVICSVHFFFALSYEKESYEFGMPSLVYFILFSIFQMKILFLAWKSRHNDLFNQDILLFRKKLLQFYSFFYMGLLCFLISLRYWYSHFIIVYCVFLSTWLFQIIHCARKGTKPPYSFVYIIFLSLSKLFIAVYIKAYPDNVFNLRPAYGKVLILALTVFIEALVLSLQKILGPKFLIPKVFREKSFDYYQSMDNIGNPENECVICLEKLEINTENISIGPSMPMKSNIKGNDKTYGEVLIDFILKFKAKINKKEYMVTPCGHSFHTDCLEKWMEMKNECPYCRNKIPPLEC